MLTFQIYKAYETLQYHNNSSYETYFCYKIMRLTWNWKFWITNLALKQDKLFDMPCIYVSNIPGKFKISSNKLNNNNKKCSITLEDERAF